VFCEIQNFSIMHILHIPYLLNTLVQSIIFRLAVTGSEEPLTIYNIFLEVFIFLLILKRKM